MIFTDDGENADENADENETPEAPAEEEDGPLIELLHLQKAGQDFDKLVNDAVNQIATLGGYTRQNTYYPYKDYAGTDHKLGIGKFTDMYAKDIKTEKYTAASDKAFTARKTLVEFMHSHEKVLAMKNSEYWMTDYFPGIMKKGGLPPLADIEKILKKEEAVEGWKNEAKIAKIKKAVEYIEAIGEEDWKKWDELIVAYLKEAKAWTKEADALDQNVSEVVAKVLKDNKDKTEAGFVAMKAYAKWLQEPITQRETLAGVQKSLNEL